jgi:OOP family OmpA-OmpF porin
MNTVPVPTPVVAAPAAPATPAAPAPAPLPGAERRQAVPVFFEPFSANLGPEAREALREIAELANAHPRARLLVVGYTSPRGTSEANTLLARLRARVVADALIEDGLPTNRVRITSRGPTVGMEDLESRRVEVRLDTARRR